MTESIEVSKRLAECAQWHEDFAHLINYTMHPREVSRHKQWAADIRATIIPYPVKDDEN